MADAEIRQFERGFHVREIRMPDGMHGDRGNDPLPPQPVEQGVQAGWSKEAKIELDGNGLYAALQDCSREVFHLGFTIARTVSRLPAARHESFIRPDELLAGGIGEYRNPVRRVQAGSKVSRIFGDATACVPSGHEADRRRVSVRARGGEA